QAAQTPAEWTVNLYDDLDRLVLTTLYHTTKTIAQLQTDIDNAVTLTTITLTNPGQPVQDIVTDHRQPGIAEYVAQHSIELHPGFESATGDNFIAKIDPGALTPIPVTTAVLGSPLSQSDLNNPAICTVVKYQFYDNYSFAKAQSFDNNIANTTAWPAGTDILPVAPDERTTGFATGSLVRVLGTDIFLASTHYYDADGNLIQTIEENIRSGTDVTTLQYHWDGRLLSTHSKHTTAGTGYSSYSILTKNVFDNIGRLVAIQKKYGSNAFKTIATYDLDDMGRLKTKHLDPDLAGGGLESLTYSYNIHNNITGINKDYALQTPGKYSKWEHYFGLYLGYDNRDGVFGASKLSGQVTGQMWNTQGDDNQRKYDYAYDDAGRLSKAAYNERKTPGEAWSNAKMDFSTGGNGTGGTIQYDLNGNLLSMQQRGVVPGAGAPATIDDLAYTYTSLSNRLKKVTDNSPLGAANGMLGDFKDGVNGGEDYLYDDNGNLIIDLNKKAQNVDGGKSTPLGTTGMLYNYLDKPESIHISGKGTIRIVYDADGNKLQRIYTPNGGTATTTTYINRFVYEESPSQGVRLSYINFEEGRIRVLNAITQNNGYDGLAIDGNIDLPDGRRGAYDYFIRDYQQNVRMILTEETHYGINEATMEAGRAAQEEPFFGQTGAANEVAQTRSSTPSGWTSNTSGSVSKLSKSSGHTIGPNVLLKVMAGDEFNAMAGYYYAGAVTNNTNPLISDIVASLVTAISGSPATPGIVHGNTANISSNLNGSVPFATIADPHQTGSGNIPRAYLNIMFFDERFEFVEEGSTVKRVSQPGDGAAPLVLSGIKAPKNGYVYIYLSNENDDAVYFDNFTVSYTRGRIIEENHYYAYGLKIAAISSRKLGDVNEGSLKNQYQWQGDYSEFDDDLNWNEFNLRSYDPQTGRFLQQDPYDQFASGYVGMGSDPVNLTDPSGGFSVPGAVIGGVAGFIAGGAYALANDKNPVTGALLGAAGGALLGGLVGDLNFGGATQAVGGALKSAAPSLAIQGANFAVNTINTNITNQYARYAGYGGDGWQDLTKPILENYYSGRYPLLTPGQLQNVIGRSFEQAWNLAADRLLKSDNYVPNSDKQTGGTRTTVPDGIADGYIQKVWGGRITVPRAAWFEVKAINGNIYNSTSTGQTLGHITNLAASVPAKYRWYGPWKASAASLTFVTTSDVAIAPSVLTEASLSNIIIYQYKAQYMMSGGFMSVRFRMTSRNGIGFFGPTTTPVVLR
ncbi:MAG TPA: RHS repeat-associated core domain-containing protein, partial [Agriterribacter sp.]|nr:RHS repeat-associated core domain-containing protein [Agriterribacter sp.]